MGDPNDPAHDAGPARELGTQAGIDDDDPLTLSETAEYLPSVFPVTGFVTAAVAASTLAAATLWATRTGAGAVPAVRVDGRHAAVAARSERYLDIDGQPAPGLWEPLSGNYPTRDGRWFLLHANMPPHRQAALAVLGADATPESVRDAIGTWAGEDLEDALAQAGGCGAMGRASDEWARHPQAVAVAQLPLIEIEQIGEAPPAAPGAAEHPAGGLRVLDLTRVIAGPVATRTLAAHGADVLRVGAPHLWDNPTLVMDTGFGKRSTHLDLRRSDDLVTLQSLARSADVVIQGYRPGSLAARGLAPERLASERPGLVCVEISAYGRLGPWALRRGWDSLVQMASGIALAGGEPYGDGRVSPLPAQALDHATGYLAAAGAMRAVARRYHQGGSWLVRVSLARTGQWLTGAGRVDALSVPDPDRQEVADLTAEMASPYGRLRFVRPPGWIDGLVPRWDSPPSLLGADPPRWAP